MYLGHLCDFLAPIPAGEFLGADTLFTHLYNPCTGLVFKVTFSEAWMVETRPAQEHRSPETLQSSGLQTVLLGTLGFHGEGLQAPIHLSPSLRAAPPLVLLCVTIKEEKMSPQNMPP